MSLLGAALLSGGALVAIASPAQAEGSQVTVTICADGNYTAYAKVVADDNSVSKTVPHVFRGQCATNSVPLEHSNVGVNIWLFGIYNIRHKGFSVCHYGGPALGMGPDLSATLRAGVTTTNPYWIDFPFGGCAPR